MTTLREAPVPSHTPRPKAYQPARTGLPEEARLVVTAVSIDLLRDGSSEETILRECPIFARLAAQWSRDGRTVPGEHDPQWHRLTELPPQFQLPTAGADPGNPMGEREPDQPRPRTAHRRASFSRGRS